MTQTVTKVALVHHKIRDMENEDNQTYVRENEWQTRRIGAAASMIERVMLEHGMKVLLMTPCY